SFDRWDTRNDRFCLRSSCRRLRGMRLGAFLVAAAAAIALSLAGCGGSGLPDTRPKLPDGGFACQYVPSGVPSCCRGGSGCCGDLWCNTDRCACEDVESPCSTGAQPLPPDTGPA